MPHWFLTSLFFAVFDASRAMSASTSSSAIQQTSVPYKASSSTHFLCSFVLIRSCFARSSSILFFVYARYLSSGLLPVLSLFCVSLLLRVNYDDFLQPLRQSQEDTYSIAWSSSPLKISFVLDTNRPSAPSIDRKRQAQTETIARKVRKGRVNT